MAALSVSASWRRQAVRPEGAPATHHNGFRGFVCGMFDGLLPGGQTRGGTAPLHTGNRFDIQDNARWLVGGLVHGLPASLGLLGQPGSWTRGVACNAAFWTKATNVAWVVCGQADGGLSQAFTESKATMPCDLQPKTAADNSTYPAASLPLSAAPS